MFNLHMNAEVIKHEFPLFSKTESRIVFPEKKESPQDTMKSYQSFDEFSMCGIGDVHCSPYVNVKKTGDSILVSSSDIKDSVRLYVKIENNVWFNHLEYDMWKEKDIIPEKCEEFHLSRTYDRYFYNDTIVEVRIGYFENQKNVNVYVKLPKKMFLMDFDNTDSVIYSNINNLRPYVFHILQSMSRNVWVYELKESNNSYSYVGVGHNYNYSYPKKAYGYWGIQPGVKETYLYEGIDIREYADNLKSFQLRNPDFKYELVDEMPEFPGGYDLMQKFIRENRNGMLEKKGQVNIEVIIEKDGSITNINISKSVDRVHNEDALRIINIMPKWKSGILNGKPVRCKIVIPVSYK